MCKPPCVNAQVTQVCSQQGVGGELQASSVQGPCGLAPRTMCSISGQQLQEVKTLSNPRGKSSCVTSMRRINLCGNTQADSISPVRHDDLRTHYLVRPLALGGRRHEPEAVSNNLQTKRQAQEPAQSEPPQKKEKGKGKEQGKKAKQNSAEKQRKKAKRNDSRFSRALKDNKDSLHSKHNGQTICYMFQSLEGCSRGQECHHQHICAHCFGSHSFDVCPKHTR